jgi:hypothetical protein
VAGKWPIIGAVNRSRGNYCDSGFVQVRRLNPRSLLEGRGALFHIGLQTHGNVCPTDHACTP